MEEILTRHFECFEYFDGGSREVKLIFNGILNAGELVEGEFGNWGEFNCLG